MNTLGKLFIPATAVVLAVACTSTPAATPTSPPAPAASATPSAPAAALTKVALQLQWSAQSQFGGYYAAMDKGYYRDEGLDVTIKDGGVNIVPQDVVVSSGAEFGLAWLPKVLASNEQGAKLVNIAQMFQRSGTLEISWKDSGITKPEDWRSKRVGTWGLGNEAELFAAMRKVGIDPYDKSHVTIVTQPFDMSLLLNRQIDAAQAMTYNEYAQVLEAVNPQTGQLVKPEELNVINFEQIGTAMLQDAIFVRENWIADQNNQETAVKFLRASFKGWIFCRDNFDECINIVMKHESGLPKGHMVWMLNESHALMWPSPNGIGMLDQKAFEQTAALAQQYKVIQSKPGANATRTDLAKKALDGLGNLDTKGTNFQKRTVQVTKGGE